MKRVFFEHPSSIVLAMITGFLVILCCAEAFAQLADTMLCADESCSETISQGEARLAYRPKDEKFLHLNKGDVVHVKSKNAGKKTHLWGGEDFLKDKIPNSETDDPYSELIGKKQTRKNEEGVDEENKNGDNSEDDDTKENEFSNKDTKNVEKIAQSEDIVQKQRSKRNIDELSVEKNLNQEFEKLQKDSQSHEDSSVNEQGESEKEPTGDTSSETVSSAKFKVENIPDKIPADLAALLGETDKDQSGSEQQVPPGRSQTPTEKNSDKKVELEPKNEVDTGDSSENDSTDVTRKKFTEKQSNEINSPINLSEPSHDMDGKKLPVLQGEGDDDVPSEDSEKNLTEIKSPTFTGSEENLPKVDDAHSESDEEKSADEPNQQPSEVTDTFTNSNEIPSEDSKAQSETLSSQTISNTVEADTQHKKDQLTSSDLPDDVNPSPGLPKTVTETEHEETGGTIHSGSTDTLVENSVTGENSPNVDIDKSGLVENTNLNLTDESKLGQVDDSTYISSAEESAEDRSETDQKLSNPKHEDGHIEMLPDPNTQNQGIEDGSETNTENIDNPVERAKTNHLESDDSKAHDLDGTNNNISVQNQETDPLNDAGTKQDDEQIAKNSVENYVDETHKVKTDASDTETDTKETKSYDSVKDKSDDQVSMKGIDKKELKSSPEKEKMDYKATDDSTGTEKEKIEQTQQVNYPDTTSGALVETADTDNFPPTHLEDSEPVDKVKVSEESDSVVVETASKIDYDILEESPHLKDGIGKNADVPEHQTGLENTENQDSLIDINEKIDEEQVEMQGTNDEDIVHSTINEIATEEVNVKEAIGDDSNESEDKSNTELTNTTSLHEEDEQNHKIVHSKHESSKEIVNEIEQDSKKVSEINNSQHQVEEAKQPNTDAKSTGESERKPNEQEIEYNDQDVVKIEEHLPTVTQPNIESNTSVENDDKTAKNKVVERNEEEDDGTIPESKSDELSHDAPDANEILKQEIETEDTKKLDSSDAEIKNVGTVSESQSVNEEPDPSGSVLQIANPDNKEIHDPSQADVIEKGAEQYNALHEGQVVDWNEMIGEKVAEKNAVGWDESLEGTDNSATLADDQPPTDIIPDEVAERELNDTVTEKPSTSATENDEIEAVPEVQYEDQTGVTTPPPETETQIVSDDTKPEDPKYNEQVLIDNHKELHAEQIETENTTVENMLENADGEIDDSIDEEKPTTDENELHVESFWLRLLLGISRIPFDMIYILEPLLNFWVSLLPEEYQNDVHGVSWKIIASTLFIGFILSWLMICRSKAVSRKRRSQHSEQTIKELKSQLENMSQEKIAAENELRTKQNEVEIQREEINNETILKETVTQEKQGLEQSLAKYNMDNENLKSDIQSLTQGLKEKDAAMQEVLNNSQQVEKSLIAQQEAITRHKETIAALQANITEHENHKQSSDVSTDKLKERMKMLEKAKGETKKEGKILKDQIEKMNTKVGELQEKLDVEVEENEAKRQEIDILKDCILQFKGAQEYLGDDAEDADSEQAIENQKEKLKSMIDVANVKTTLRQTEAEKLQVTYELEAERKSRLDNEGKISELEATINSNTALHNKLEKEKQMLDSKLTVMQEFYAKREVEIQSKLGLEQSKRESNASMLEDQQHKQLELLQQLDAYKKMGEEAKHKYDDAERQHKQEVLAFEKKSHENWLACRSTERKLEEATKQINQLHLELSDARHRLHDREPIIRPRPERHGPPGAPPPFGPPLRKPLPGSPLHFRNGPPPDMRRRSSPPRRPPSPGGSIPGDRPPSRPERPTSRPDRPPSTHSLPPMDRPPQPRPPFPNTPGREFRPYRDDIPPGRPPLRDAPHQGRPGPRMPGGPMNSSPYMERPPIPPSQSPGSRSMNYTQSTLHATPPQSTGDGLRNDGLPPPPNASERPPPGMDSGQGNPFRRGRS